MQIGTISIAWQNRNNFLKRLINCSVMSYNVYSMLHIDRQSEVCIITRETHGPLFTHRRNIMTMTGSTCDVPLHASFSMAE